MIDQTEERAISLFKNSAMRTPIKIRIYWLSFRNKKMKKKTPIPSKK